MRKTYLIFAILLTLCFTSCGQLTEFVDYTVNEYAKIIPNDPSYERDRAYIDAYQSGLGGKVLAGVGVATKLFGNSSNQTYQDFVKRVDNAITSLNSDENYRKDDVNNWFGMLLTVASEMETQHKINKGREYQADPETSDMIEYFDDETGEIIWKDWEVYVNEQINKRRLELENSFEENSIDITPEEYESLPNDKRHEIAVLLLEKVKTKNQQKKVHSQPTNNEAIETPNVVSPYIEKIESSFIGNYMFNEVTLTEVQKKELDNIYDYLASDNSISIEIVGHTCSIGSEDVNYNVGLQRAMNAKKYLVKKGVDRHRINVISKSYNSPKASNNTHEGRAQNRRITFNIIKN